MKCVRCGTDNISSADYCIACRAPVRFRRRSERYQKRKVIITTTIVVVWVSCFAFFFKDVLFPEKPFPETTLSQKAEYEAQREAARRKLFAQLHDIKASEKNSEAAKAVLEGQNSAEELNTAPVKTSDDGHEVVSGTVTIYDPWNRELANIRTALFDNGWLALPTRACLGGATWAFAGDFGEGATVQGGVWREGMPVSLWQIDKELESEKGVGLAVWDNNLALHWLSLNSDKEFDEVRFTSLKKEGDFTVATMINQPNEAGIFVQGVEVVGWSFGPWLSGAYLWTPSGQESKGRRQNISVADFYNMTFANGREEKFSIALAAHDESNVINTFNLFLDGFRVQPRLSPADTPYFLLPAEIIKQLRILLNKAVARGLEKQVVDLLDNNLLKLIGDIELFMDIVPSISRVYGYGAAVKAIEDIGATIVQRLGVNVPELNELHLSYYQDWLQVLVSKGEQIEGQTVYLLANKFYPNDPYIHLLATELEVLKGNWAEAERLLYQRNYPPELLDRYELLVRQVSDLKGQEGNIVVRFQPGSTRIPVDAALNGRRRQEFLVDTGASLVTIPSSAVVELGLEIISGDHYEQRQVSTAGGVRMASEVVLDSLEIGGWVEYEVKALVLDIPDQPGLGLLGLNYLSRFAMDLRSEEGLLSLTPR